MKTAEEYWDEYTLSPSRPFIEDFRQLLNDRDKEWLNILKDLIEEKNVAKNAASILGALGELERFEGKLEALFEFKRMIEKTINRGKI